MKKILLFLFAFTTYTSFAQETFPVNGTTNHNHNVYAFINAKIVVDANETIDNGILLAKDGIIIGVGTKTTVPKGAVVYDLKVNFCILL